MADDKSTLPKKLFTTGLLTKKNSTLLTDLVKATNGEALDFQDLAKDPKTPPHVLKTLFETNDDTITEFLVSNPRLPESLALRIISPKNKEGWKFEEDVAGNCKITKPLFLALTANKPENERPSSSIIERIMANPHCSVVILRRCYHMTLRNMTWRMTPREQGDILVSLLENPKAPSDLLAPTYAHLAELVKTTHTHEYEQVDAMESFTRKLVENPRCPTDLFVELMNSGSVTIRHAGAKNPVLFSSYSTDLGSLRESLWNDKSVKGEGVAVWEMLAQNPRCNKYYLNEFAKIQGDYSFTGRQKSILRGDCVEKIDPAVFLSVLRTYKSYTRDGNNKRWADDRIEEFHKKLIRGKR